MSKAVRIADSAGTPAKVLIGIGAFGLLAATVWNVLLRRAGPQVIKLSRANR
jgi:hypothetical protein